MNDSVVTCVYLSLNFGRPSLFRCVTEYSNFCSNFGWMNWLVSNNINRIYILFNTRLYIINLFVVVIHLFKSIQCYLLVLPWWSSCLMASLVTARPSLVLACYYELWCKINVEFLCHTFFFVQLMSEQWANLSLLQGLQKMFFVFPFLIKTLCHVVDILNSNSVCHHRGFSNFVRTLCHVVKYVRAYLVLIYSSPSL